MSFIIRSSCFKRVKLVQCLKYSTSNQVDSLFDGLIKCKRCDLARSITLIETTNPEKKKQSQLLLHKVLDDLKQKRLNNLSPSLRIGITGPPG